MLATYGSFLLILAASCLVGQALFALCGRREWSWLAPAVGLALLTAVSWGTVRLPGEGTASSIAIAVLALIAVAYLVGRVAGLADAVRLGLPVVALGLLAASIPFFVERRFGILGTGLNPDMSQHLFAADRLASGEAGKLLSEGYPLGPHALVVAATKSTGASLVHAFDGLALAISVIAALTPLAVLRRVPMWRRVVGAVLIGLPYMAASYLIQGAFKETIEALFVLAFAIGLHELARGSLTVRPQRAWRAALAALPLAALAVGSAYSYSFPGLLWLGGAAGLWAVLELALAAGRDSLGAAVALAQGAAAATGVALAASALAVAPEIGRMVEFAGFETFDPSGPGLGNLFNPISPLEALGIWPSGDFRLDPGAGAVPAVGFYLGATLGLVALAYGLAWWLRRGDRAVPAALAVAALLFAYAHFAGTPYQEAKAIVLASPLAMLITARALLSGESLLPLTGVTGAVARLRGGMQGIAVRVARPAETAMALTFLVAAAGCSVLALANGPVGPASYTPQLTELRSDLRSGSTLALAPLDLIDENGRDYVVWELRGNRVCVKSHPGGPPHPRPPGAGISQVVTIDSGRRPPFTHLRLVRRAGPYTLWYRRPVPRGDGPCPLISTGARANPAPEPPPD